MCLFQTGFAGYNLHPLQNFTCTLFENCCILIDSFCLQVKKMTLYAVSAAVNEVLKLKSELKYDSSSIILR